MTSQSVKTESSSRRIKPIGFDTFLPFSTPTLSDTAIAEVVSCLKSGWITTGPRVEAFEEKLRNYLCAPYALTVSSATAGLYLVLQALELEVGDEVITTPLTFVATLNVIVMNRLRPVLVDISPSTYNMDMEKLADKITPRTRAIMPIHFAGLPVDLDPLYALAHQHNLRVIEDAAHAIGASYQGKPLGSCGDIQVFSFHPNKNMTTGEGGCIALRDKALAQKISCLRFHGIDRIAWNRFGKSGSQLYDVLTPAHKFNMMDIQAALGLHQLSELNGFIQRRTHLAQRYRKKLESMPALQLPQQPSYSHCHAWHLFAPTVNPDRLGYDRLTLMDQLKEYNIGTGLHYSPVHLYTYYHRHFKWQRGDFPHAETVGDRIFSLPLFPTLTETQQDKVIEVLEYVCTQTIKTV